MYAADISLSAKVRPATFSRALCLSLDSGVEDRRCVAALARLLAREPAPRILCGKAHMARYFLSLCPELAGLCSAVVVEDADASEARLGGLPVLGLEQIPADTGAALLCETGHRALNRLAKALPPQACTVTLDSLTRDEWRDIPRRAWIEHVEHIYPLDIPEIAFLPGKELLLLDFPARSISQLPVGLGYVHDALKRAGVDLQTVDLDTVLYHRFHSDRLLDGVPEVRTPGGRPLPNDPWQPVHYLEWEKPDTLDYFQPDLEEIVAKLAQARPKIVACSVHQVNRAITIRAMRALRQVYPDFTLIVGGMSCLQPDVASIVFPEAEYVVVGEADLTIGPLVQAILRGETPRDLPGIWSRFDTPGRVFVPGPIPENLDDFGHPRFEWTDIGLYRNWDGYRLAPLVASRGCPWAKCTFCGERFRWRYRTPELVVDDIEFYAKHGFGEVVFNESDLHGDTDIIERLCDEVIRRKIRVQFTAQLRCNRKATRAYYEKLKRAGFGCLRFGVDGWSDHSLKLQQKGYTKQTIRQTLMDTKAAGIYTEVNIVTGVPGETDADVDECIALLVAMKPYIGRVAFINPFMLFRGSYYWDDPEKYGIVFHQDKKELYESYPVAIPDALWHSENPHIGAEERYERFIRIVRALHENGFNVTGWVDFSTKEVEKMSGQDAHAPGSVPADDTVRQTLVGTAEAAAGLTDGLQDGPPAQYRGYDIRTSDQGCQAWPAGTAPQEGTTAQPGRSALFTAESFPDLARRVDMFLDAMAARPGLIVRKVEDEFLVMDEDELVLPASAIRFEPDAARAARPLLVATRKGHSIVTFGGAVFVIPVSLGPTDLNQQSHRERPGVRLAFSVRHAQRIIDQISPVA